MKEYGEIYRNKHEWSWMFRFFRYIYMRNVYSVLKKYYRSGNILEIGSGSGQMLPYFRRMGQVYTQDIESSADIVCPLPKLHGFGWGLVYAAHVLEHMPTAQDVQASFRNVSDRLMHRGFFSIIVPDYIRWGVDYWDSDGTHAWPATYRRIRQMAKMAGLRIVYRSHLSGFFIGWMAEIVSIAWCLVPFRHCSERLRRIGYSLNGDLFVVMQKI